MLHSPRPEVAIAGERSGGVGLRPSPDIRPRSHDGRSTRDSPPGPAAGPATTGPSRLRALDGLRLTVALMVAFYHFFGHRLADEVWGEDASAIFPSADVLVPYGWLGVEIFFIISGFVICMSSWGRSVGAFFRSRVCRLYPAYWAAVCLTYLVVTVAPVLDDSPSFNEAVANLTMLQMPMGAQDVDPVYWTLWVELRFYLIFALVVSMGLTYRRVMAFAAAWTLLAPVAGAGDSKLLKILVVPEYASYFLVGIGLYLLHRFGNQLLTWALIAVNVAVCVLHVDRRVISMGKNWVDSPMHTWVATVILLAAIALLIAIAQGRLDWMSWKWLTFAGALTYPFYLLHQMIGYSVIHYMYVGKNISAYVVLPVTLTATLCLAWMVHLVVERPLAGVLKRQLSAPGLLEPAPRDQARR